MYVQRMYDVAAGGQGKVMCFLFVFFFVLVSVPSLGSCTNGRNVDYDEMKTGDEPGFV